METILARLDAMNAQTHIMRTDGADTYRIGKKWACKIMGQRDGLKVETEFMRGDTAAEAIQMAWNAFEPAASLVEPPALAAPQQARVIDEEEMPF